MWIFYTVPVIILIIGLIIWIFNHEITWQEWIGSSVVGFLLAVIFQAIAFYGLTADIETWSGTLTYAEHHPRWVEEYEEAVYKTVTHTDSKGNTYTTREFSHYETRHDTHPEHWVAYFNYGEISNDCEISLPLFNEIKSNFGSNPEFNGKQRTHHGGDFDGGDNNIYIVRNKTGYIYPSTITRHFENRIKAAPTVFSFAQVPTNCPVYEWPQNPNRWVSDRLLGEGRISILEFDRMNSRLGPAKKVNCIMINFGLKDSSIADWQQAMWLNGKKNDIVLCYGQIQTNGLPVWARVFGWSESEICKRNLETILLQNPATDTILPLLENEIKANYVKKDWSKFKYISIEPPSWSYWVYFIVIGIVQIGLWIWFHVNYFSKE